MEFIYCVECENSVLVQKSLVGMCHESPFYDEFGRVEVDWCFFNLGWATCPEPEYDPDWDLNLVEPEEEIETMEIF